MKLNASKAADSEELQAEFFNYGIGSLICQATDMGNEVLLTTSISKGVHKG